MRPRQDKHRRWVTIRRQKPNPKQPDRPLRWCAACQRCSRGCMATTWPVVLTWATVHPGHCGGAPTQAPSGFIPFRSGPVQPDYDLRLTRRLIEMR